MTKHLSWGEVQHLVDDLVQNKIRGKCDLVLGVHRSGLVPATMISHALKIPLVTVMFDNMFSDLKTIILAIQKNTNILVVDDINRTGTTFSSIDSTIDRLLDSYKLDKKILVFYCSLLQEKDTKFASCYTGEVIPTNEKVVFPWQMTTQNRKTTIFDEMKGAFESLSSNPMFVKILSSENKKNG